MFKQFLEKITQVVKFIIVIAPWEQGLRVRLGKHVKLLEAGIHLRIPFVDRVYCQPIRRRLCVIPAQTVTTDDGRAVTLSGALGYRIINLRTLYDNLHDAQDTLETMAASCAASYIFGHSLEDLKPEEIEDHVSKSLGLDRFGLGDTEFKLCNFAAVRTFRFISGGFRDWQTDRFNTSNVLDSSSP